MSELPEENNHSENPPKRPAFFDRVMPFVIGVTGVAAGFYASNKGRPEMEMKIGSLLGAVEVQNGENNRLKAELKQHISWIQHDQKMAFSRFMNDCRLSMENYRLRSSLAKQCATPSKDCTVYAKLALSFYAAQNDCSTLSGYLDDKERIKNVDWENRERGQKVLKDYRYLEGHRCAAQMEDSCWEKIEGDPLLEEY
jgi:hypothetical protein